MLVSAFQVGRMENPENYVLVIYGHLKRAGNGCNEA